MMVILLVIMAGIPAFTSARGSACDTEHGEAPEPASDFGRVWVDGLDEMISDSSVDGREGVEIA